MNTSRLLFGTLALCALPIFAQPETKPTNGLSYPLVTLEEALRLVETKPIKLHVRDVTVKAALELVEQQTGETIEMDNFPADLNKKLSLDIETNSFKEATAAIFEEADVTASVRKFGRGNSWIVNWGRDVKQNNEAPLSGTGPFKIRLQSLSSNLNKSVRLGKTPIRNQSTNLNANFSLETDSHLPIVGTPRVETTRAEDDQGHSLRVDERNPFIYDAGGSDSINVRLREPAKDAHSISHLDGKVIYVLATKHETWEVADLLHSTDPAHDFGEGPDAVHVSITKAHKVDNGVELEVVAKAPTAMQGGMNMMRQPLLQFNQLTSAIRLIDANGQLLRPGGMGGNGSGNQQTIRVTYWLPPAFVDPPQNGQPPAAPAPPVLAEPLKFVLEAPTDFVQTEVPFSFSNLPLP